MERKSCLKSCIQKKLFNFLVICGGARLTAILLPATLHVNQDRFTTCIKSVEQFLEFFPQVQRGHSKGIFLYKWIGRRKIQTELDTLFILVKLLCFKDLLRSK